MGDLYVRSKCLRNGTNLVYFKQESITSFLLVCNLYSLEVSGEQIVTYKLDLACLVKLCPGFPVILSKWVL